MRVGLLRQSHRLGDHPGVVGLHPKRAPSEGQAPRKPLPGKGQPRQERARIERLDGGGESRRLEGYLRRTDIEKYRALIKKLGIREVKPK